VNFHLRAVPKRWSLNPTAALPAKLLRYDVANSDES
jgi:hypothetical protein